MANNTASTEAMNTALAILRTGGSYAQAMESNPTVSFEALRDAAKRAGIEKASGRH